jgi:hypothetical protein
MRVFQFILILVILNGCHGGEESKQSKGSCIRFCVPPNCHDLAPDSVSLKHNTLPSIKLESQVTNQALSPSSLILIPDSLVNMFRLDFYSVTGQFISEVTQICPLTLPVEISLYQCLEENSSGVYFIRFSRNDTAMAVAKVVYLK